MSQQQITGILDPAEAPEGYYAVLKESVAGNELGNICRACDWRSECQKPDADLARHDHRCMGYPIIVSKDGKEISRNDGCSVVFKRIIHHG